MGKGEETKQAIVDQALELASTVGLEKLTIGTLAGATGMSKSGLFAHFRSKEQLQLQVLVQARQRFIDIVIAPALKKPRGEARLRAIFETSVKQWEEDLPGGCIFHAVSAELDDRPGPARDYLVDTQRDFADTLRRAAEIAIEEGEFRKGLDLDQFVFELGAITAGYHHSGRLLGDPDAEQRARDMFEGLLARSH
ncbi:MAG: TetR/AcrR family transcriptional regulator [Deltaproteobacteria bacterium]|nr:TetR/AcrR family transcriptional regulator [Deltaproteobacteria bacterium]MBW2405517.1 TetR/AcrR family transcriptional regulator [Deltaproteobacteria bacterium]MBW2720181.1 TetR/AcrR family transcriptional regulator [Deltaproteobacteria bacterium]RLB51793.1 MAG: TetR/AcrR family transcriptional regulator [Deltaproteobacteria bacterium]